MISDIKKNQKLTSQLKVKDHEEDFPYKRSFRLINLSKSEKGKVSKRILDSINNYIMEQTLTSGKSASVIECFKATKNKQECTFLVFDIESFYPSISLDLFNKALKFAKEIIPIADSDLKIMMHSRKALSHGMLGWSRSLQFNWPLYIKQNKISIS